MITVQTAPVRFQCGRFVPAGDCHSREGTMGHANRMAHHATVEN